ncbi:MULTISPECIES: hypothetical protein [Mycobacteriaceae]|uniref:hypothetical protein n=1 Tax=Mycobacteriaceae TaxID=1762 RepID=UPI002269F60D|nr:hypothetical protein [Mycolicibacterium mucogenicum]MCX8557044.1 hypothetical protein [Mycolicibacterium mucogenicum]
MKLIKTRGGEAAAEKTFEATASVDELAADECEGAAEVDAAETTDAAPVVPRRRVAWANVAVYGLLPAVVLALGGAAGYLQWKDVSLSRSDTAKKESTKAATDGTVALLSYKPETVDKDLEAAKKYMTGNFLNSYTLAHPRRGDPRVQAEEDLGRRHRTRGRLDEGDAEPCGRDAVRGSDDDHRRQRPDEYRVERACDARQGR